MIKVVIERQVKKGKDISPLLYELRVTGMRYPGYISGETLVSTEDSSLVVTISTWQSLEHWKRWEQSEDRAKIHRKIEQLLTRKPQARTLKPMTIEESSSGSLEL